MLLALDRATSEKMFRLGESVPRPLWQLLELSGDGIVWLAIAISTLLIPGTSIERKTYIANFLLGLLLDLAETGLLKGFVRRDRPVYNAIAKDMRVVVNVDNYSFPSGHSSR
jgi:membrane-associated phospholipid phosphatase